MPAPAADSPRLREVVSALGNLGYGAKESRDAAAAALAARSDGTTAELVRGPPHHHWEGRSLTSMPRRPVTAMAFLAGLVAGLALSHGYGLAYVRASQLNVRQVMTLFHRELRAELALLPADHQLVTQATARAAMTRALEENERRESWSVLWRGLTQSE